MTTVGAGHRYEAAGGVGWSARSTGRVRRSSGWLVLFTSDQCYCINYGLTCYQYQQAYTYLN